MALVQGVGGIMIVLRPVFHTKMHVRALMMRTCKLWLGKSGVSNGRKVSTDHGFQLQMWFYATMASNCRCDFTQQWPPTILRNNGLQQWPPTILCNNGLQLQLWFYATMASNNIMQQWPPTADVISCNNGLQQFYATVASNCRCDFMQQALVIWCVIKMIESLLVW